MTRRRALHSFYFSLKKNLVAWLCRSNSPYLDCRKRTYLPATITPDHQTSSGNALQSPCRYKKKRLLTPEAFYPFMTWKFFDVVV